MELGAIFLLLAVIAIVVMFVSGPFTEHWRVRVEMGRQVSSLMAERDRILSSLQDLDFDHALGKIPAEEYPVQRTILLQKGADVLRQLDEFQGAGSVDAEEQAGHIAVKSPQSLSDDDVEDLIAKRRTNRKGLAVGFCHKCGRPISQSDQFCPTCGQAVTRK
jgi:hypothetical protein